MPEVIINGPEGRIEGRYHHARAGTGADGAGAASAPAAWRDDEQQGRLHALSELRARGFSTLRFNFRGVGRSQGSFDRGEGELADAAAALDWLQTYNPNAGSCWVAGYSFGAWIGMQLLMRRPEIEAFIAVAPPANQLRFHLPRAVPLLGPDPAGRPGHAGAARIRCRSWCTSCRISATSRSISARSPAPTISSPTSSSCWPSHADAYIGGACAVRRAGERGGGRTRAAGGGRRRITSSSGRCAQRRPDHAAAIPNTVATPTAPGRTCWPSRSAGRRHRRRHRRANSSIGAQTSAEATLASQNRPRGICMIPAASGITARIGPKKRPIKTLLPPCRAKKPMPLGSSSGLRVNGHIRAMPPPNRRPIQYDTESPSVAPRIAPIITGNRARCRPHQRAGGDQQGRAGKQQAQERERLAEGGDEHDQPPPNAHGRR